MIEKRIQYFIYRVSNIYKEPNLKIYPEPLKNGELKLLKSIFKEV